MEQRHYLKEQLCETLKVVDSCLDGIYTGSSHMCRPLAGQLRILLCDTQHKKDNSLFTLTYPKLEVSSMMPISWSDSGSAHVELRQSINGNSRIAQMPFEVTVYSNGLAVADLQLVSSTLIPIGKWSSQAVTVYPTLLSVFEVIRTVADKGGGSHVDAQASAALRYMSQKTPAGPTYAELFVVALGRFIQRLGEQLYGYSGSRVSAELLNGQTQKLNLIMAAHKEWAEALTNGSIRPATSPARPPV